jgi:hypothetical protein
MGTSTSSTGPAGGVPFDPPWLDDIPLPMPGGHVPPDDDTQTEDSGDNQLESPPQSTPFPIEIAPPKRFYNARRALGVFARTGQKDAFNRAVGHYSKTGMGGARNAARRMRISTRTGAKVFDFLQSVREGTNPLINDWVSSLITRKVNPQEIARDIIRHVVPIGGSQDEAACQESMAQAIGDLLANYPGIDLLHLGNGDIWTLIESFLSYEAFHRLYLDIGQVFEDSSLNPRDRVKRVKEIQNYLQAEIKAQIEGLRVGTTSAGSEQLQSILQNALKNTFTVYEGSI